MNDVQVGNTNICGENFIIQKKINDEAHDWWCFKNDKKIFPLVHRRYSLSFHVFNVNGTAEQGMNIGIFRRNLQSPIKILKWKFIGKNSN